MTINHKVIDVLNKAKKKIEDPIAWDAMWDNDVIWSTSMFFNGVCALGLLNKVCYREYEMSFKEFDEDPWTDHDQVIKLFDTAIAEAKAEVEQRGAAQS